MANVLKITVDGRTWNCYLDKFEDECTEEEIRIADEIIGIDRSMIAAHEIRDEDKRLEQLQDLKSRKLSLEAMIGCI